MVTTRRLKVVTSNLSRSKRNILARNDVIFDKKKCFTPIYRLFSGRLTGRGSGPHFKKRPTNQIWKRPCRLMEIIAMKISLKMDGCFLIGLELNLFIQSFILLMLFVSFSTSAGDWNYVIMNSWVQNSCRGRNKIPLSKNHMFIVASHCQIMN